MTCERCQDSGYVVVGREYELCDCRLIQKAREYLTSMYQGVSRGKVDAVWKKELFLYVQSGVDIFRRLVKGFLLETGMQYDHLTVRPYEVADRMYDKEVNGRFTQLGEVD